jgi:hypothetical protein
MFTDLTLYSDSELSGSPIATAGLSNVQFRNNRGIVSAEFPSGRDYYLRLRKTGFTQQAVTLLYTAIPPSPASAEELEDY